MYKIYKKKTTENQPKVLRTTSQDESRPRLRLLRSGSLGLTS